MAHFRSNTKRRFRSGSLAGLILLGGIGAALAAGPFEYSSFNRNQTAPTPQPAGVSKIAQPKRPIHLNHYSADWDKVIETLAEQSNLTLVMREVPPGKFSRRDNNDYSPEEAIRVLNHQLEKKGFRLLQQNDYLIVLNLDSVRTRYEPSTIPRSTPIQQTQQPRYVLPTEKNGYQRKFTDVRVSQLGNDQTPAHQPRKHYGGPGQVQAAAHQVVAPTRVPSQPIQKIIAPKISALEVARILHGNFGDSSQLLDSGPGGYPAFQVKYDRQGNARDKVTFAIGIDTGENRLIVEAPEAAAREIEHAVQFLDRDVALGQKSFKMVPSTHNVSKLAGDLQPRMNRLLAMNAQETGQPAQDFNPPPDSIPRPNGPQGPVDTGAISSAMRSEVTVQAMPELGALVISGNEKDVEAVMAVIREIEKMSVGTAPSIELLILKHVDATQLSTLLDSVYEDLTGRITTAIPQAGQAATGPSNRAKVTFIPITKPNSLLILAPEADMESIKELASALDQPVDPTTEFEVYSLKSAIATQVVTLLTNFFAEREGLGGSISAFADVRTNSIIVRARPRDLTEAGALIKKIDRDATGSVSKMKVIAMKFSVAQEVADVLNEAFQSLLLPPGQNNALAGAAGAGFAGTGESSQQLREIKSLAVEFLSVAGGKEELIRSGIVADIRITADPRINSLLVTAPEKSMNLIEALINHLDRLPSSIAEIKVFTLQNSDATQAAELLQNLLGTTTTGGGGGGFGQQQQQTASGIQVAGATDVTNALVPIRFSVDVRTNSVIAVGGADALRVVEAVLLRLDEDDIRERKTTVIKLKNSPAEDVANAINDFLDTQRELNQSTPDLISNIELLEREIVVVPELVTNSLLVSATPRYYDSIMEVIEKLDAAPPQVIIQALLVEVELGNTDEFGIELGLQDSVLFGRSGLDAMTGALAPGFLFNTPVLGNSPTATNTQSVGGQGLSNFGVGRTNDDLGFGGLVLSASSESVSVLIRALAARRNVQILSRPQIRTLDNVQAQIQVGQQVPVVNGVNITNTGQANPNIEQQETGIILTVRPRITPEGTIIMETVAEKSQLSDDGVPIFVDTNGTVITSPIINVSGASATVSVPNGHTIVMGGMITKTDTTLERKVPWLGDVPILGRAFRFDSTSSARTELLIFLTPRVIMNSADSEFIKQVESERMHYVEEDAEAVHGPLFAVPPTPGDSGQFIQLPDGTLMAPEAFDEVIDAPVIQQMGGTAPPASRQTQALPTNRQTQSLPKEQKTDKSSWVKWPFKK